MDTGGNKLTAIANSSSKDATLAFSHFLIRDDSHRIGRIPEMVSKKIDLFMIRLHKQWQIQM